jgi:23S rRNA pseudouridine1911/1915/1917 synthase
VKPESEPESIVVTQDQAGGRLDSFLASTTPELSRTKIQRAIDDGDVLVNDIQVKSSYRLRPGDKIDLDLPKPVPVDLIAEPIPINIVFEDEDIAVVDKPAGLVVHPGAGNPSGTLANALVHHFNRLSGTAGTIRPGIVHRLDKETSGLLVVAKNDLAHERLAEQFSDGKVRKSYVALVYGKLSVAHGEIEARIGRSSRNRTRMAVLRGNAGRPAHTLFEVASRFQEFTLLDVEIKTGRTHQIRVHMVHIGHPVVGDTTYGAGREKMVRDSAVRREILGLGRHFLHSAELAFEHPRTREILRFTSALPLELQTFLSILA